MTEQVQSLLHYILAKKHHEGRAAIDEPPVSKEKSFILRRSERFVRRCGAEQPRLLPGERIAFVRTGIYPPRSAGEDGMQPGGEETFIHEMGYISNLNPRYEETLAVGLLEQRRRVSVHFGGTQEQREFAQALTESIDAILDLSDRYRLAALDAGDTELAAVLERVPRYGARSFREALQFFRILHFSLWLDGEYHNTTGRFDQYMWPYLRADIERGALNHDAALDLLEDFFLSFNKDSDLYPGVQQGDNGQSMVLGGCDAEGNDAFNLLSELCLKASEELKLIDPKLNLRVSAKTPFHIYELGTRLTKVGLGFPQYSNDDVVIPALVRYGYDLNDARNYVVAACWEFIIPGCGMEIPNIGALSFAKCIDTAVHRYLRTDETFDAFLGHTLACVREEADRLTAFFARREVRFSPSALMSMLMDGCVERGTDITNGSKYNNFGLHGTGVSTAADSLAAIRKYLYEERRFTAEDFIDAVDHDFAGQEELLDLVRYHAPKFGQDDGSVDQLAVLLLDTFADALEGKKNRRGGCFRAGTGSAMFYLLHVQELGASPDGRRKGEGLGTNFSPSLYARNPGPLSVIRSFTKPHLQRVCNGGPLTLEFHSTLFSDDDAIRKVAALVQTFIRMGGHQLQLNALNTETLRDAQRHPEKYPQLVVRIWGWSAYFVELDKCYQDHVLARQEYSL